MEKRRGCGISEERVAQIRKIQKTFSYLSSLLDDVCENKISQSELADKLGITPQEVNTAEQKCMAPYLKRVGVFSEKEFAQILRNAQTPCECLVRDVLDLDPLDKMLVIDLASEEEFEKAMKETLTEREYKAVRMYYGFDGSKRMRQIDIGKEFNISQERIRQILNMALRKLRNPKCWKRLLPEYRKYMSAASELPEVEKRAREYEEEYQSLMRRYRYLAERGKILDSLRLVCKEADERFADKDAQISSLQDFPLGWALALMQNNIITVRDLESLTEEDFCKLAGKDMFYSDLVAACDRHGIRLLSEVKAAATVCEGDNAALNLPVNECGFSVRAYNCLRKAGCETLRDVVSKGREGLLRTRNMGQRSIEEIIAKLGEYNLELKD